MDIKISAIRFKADKKLEQFITEKINKLSKLHDEIIGSDVTLKLENSEDHDNKIVEIRVKIKGNDVLAEKKSKSFEESTDLAIEAVKKQLLKVKEKQQRR